jgi:hypothetical protein
MEVNFAKTFGESLQRMINRERWYWKLWDLFRYDIPRFVKNVWRFRKPLLNYYWWDHHAALQFMQISLDNMSTNIESKGLEIDVSRLKKVAAMQRASQLIKNYNGDLYIEMAEAELGEVIHHEWKFVPVEGKEDLFELEDLDTPEEKAHNRKVFARAREIQEAEWAELWQLFKGQDHSAYQSLMKPINTKEDRQKDQDHYYDWFDGSDMRGWWD